MSPAEDFWSFSLSFYRREGVEAVLLALQDETNADINMLLLMLWAARQNILLSEKDVSELDSSIADWRSTVIAPLRAIRRRMKQPIAGIAGDDCEQLRSSIKTLEIEAERVEQQQLARGVGPLSGRTELDSVTAATENLAVYARVLKVDFGQQPIGVLIAAFRGETHDGPAASR